MSNNCGRFDLCIVSAAHPENTFLQPFDTIETNIKVFNNGQLEVKLAEKLEKAEQTKFFQGDSDFFVVNLREQMTAEAQIKNIMSALKVNKFKAQIQSVILQTELNAKLDSVN